MRFLGAKVVLTPAALKGSGMLGKAAELAAEHGWFFVRQFENEANADIHSRTTAPEILEDFVGERLDAWVTGFGSGGTLKGVARVLRKERPDTRIYVCEPDNSRLLGSGVAQSRNADGSPAGSHPSFHPHTVQGWSPDFIPKLVEDAVTADLFDEVVPIDGNEALRLARRLATEEGILAGISGGATLAGALSVCRRLPAGANVLCMLPDTGERYLSTPLFADIPADMDAEELQISSSTQGARFDQPVPASCPAPVAAAASVAAPVNVEAQDFVAAAISDAENPVVMFALEWCEFCWAVRKLLQRLGIAYRSVDIDSVAYQEGGRGERIRAALTARTGVPTIPQIFIGGTLVGGAVDMFKAWGSGHAQQLLQAAGVPYATDVEIEARQYLPGWLQAR